MKMAQTPYRRLSWDGTIIERLFENISQGGEHPFRNSSSFASGLHQGSCQERAKEIAGKLPHLKQIVISVSPEAPAALNPNLKPRCRSHITFNFFPSAEHLENYRNADVWKQTLPGVVGHLSIAIEGNNAVITQIQGNATTIKEELRVNSKIRWGYRNWQEALTHAAILYCKEKNLNLWMLHEKEYAELAQSTWGPKRIRVIRVRKRGGNLFGSLRKKFAFRKRIKTDPIYGRSAVLIHAAA